MHALAGVAERRVAEVVAERDRLGQLFVQPQHLGDRPRDLRDLERVRQPRAVVVAGRREEHLRLVLQPAERLAVDDAVAIALKRRPDVVLRLGAETAARVRALGRLRRQDLAFALLRAPRGCIAACRRPTMLVQKARAVRAAGRRRRRRPASGQGRRTSRASRGRRRAHTRARRPAAGRIRASGRCSASSDRCRDRR